ncbi:uncharacterized protein CG43867 isoform X3 [Daktulosphaira vitifoliae]|uniref:uncharacterized protein CG43867 isoform X3 n=1 Tax=Daktulosphaira vitifoliae TaxID=58002 RepID=UPI0021AA8C56|nr:uncharacterized protein CG43867 isoform X3 [Daktulosphaira vitifoliae]
MDPDPLCGLSECSSTSARSSWSSSGAENSEEEWRNQVDELQWYISSSTSPRTIKHINGCDVVRNSIGWHELSELERRVLEAETRALEAEGKVRVMEERLQAEWNSHLPDQTEKEQAISKLATQVEEQRQLRLQDAKMVEAKAARIKEWVTNKLRDLEAQNQHLREQNHKCNQQLELLRRHMAQLSADKMAQLSSDKMAVSACAGTSAPRTSTASLHRANSTGSTHALSDNEPVYAQVERNQKYRTPERTQRTHRRHMSACSQVPPPNSTVNVLVPPHNQLANESISATTDALNLKSVRPKSVCIESDIMHDYAEIYTPSREKLSWDKSSNKPPTPPLHRCPSWESRIYQVANEGLSTVHSSHIDSNIHQSRTINSQGYCDISVPVYATVKGRASQIRSCPFTGDSSDDSSDGEGEHTNTPNTHSVTTRITNSSSTDNTDTSMSSSSPSKSHKTTSTFSPIKHISSGSPSKNTSMESGISDDYAIPPDAMSCGEDSAEWSSLVLRLNLNGASVVADSPSKCNKTGVLDKSGHLAKLGGKLKTWRRRFFVLSNGKLRYWKTQNDISRKPQREITIDDLCRITRQDGAATFEISTIKKTYYLTADSIAAMEDWVKVLQNVQRHNATRLLLNNENNKPTIQGWLTKVRNGHAKRCWCVLIGKTFLYFKSSTDTSAFGQINMRDCQVETVDHFSDSDGEERDSNQPPTIVLNPSHQGPSTYLLMSSKQEKDSWLYHLTVVSGSGNQSGSQFEQIVQKLLEASGDPNCVLWKHPILLHSKDAISTPLTTLSVESLQYEAIKLFKSCQLFMSVAIENAGIDYHVVLAQNALQLCLDNWELQAEMLSALIKQTSRHASHKHGVQQLLLCATQSLFTCDAALASSPTISTTQSIVPGSPSHSITAPSSPASSSLFDHCKANPPMYVFVQGWQLLALAVSLFVPKNTKLLWFLKLHLKRNIDTKTECGKYAAYCERALERTIANGVREVKPSRMEVLSILLKNPYHHSLPHSIPVHLLNGTYQVAGFDGSTIIEEFLCTLNQETGCRDSSQSGFTLFSDDPIEKDLEHYIEPHAKLCDVISKWETALREKGSGKFENTRVIRLIFKNRLYFKSFVKKETDRERLLLCYQINQKVVHGHFPLTKELALELAALMAQIDFGEFYCEKNRGSGGNTKDLQVLQALDKFYPYRYRDGASQETIKHLQTGLQDKWISLKGRTVLDCVRIYLTCTRKWPYFGCSLFQAKMKHGENTILSGTIVWLAVSEDSVSLLELRSMQLIETYMYDQVLTFGGCQDDFMLVIASESAIIESHKLLFSMSKPKILEITLLIADYMNALALNNTSNSTPNSLNRNMQPDILKATPDHQIHRTESQNKKRIDS